MTKVVLCETSSRFVVKQRGPNQGGTQDQTIPSASEDSTRCVELSFLVPVKSLLEASNVVLRDGVGACTVLLRRCAGVASVVLARIAIRIERRLCGGRSSWRGREVLTAGGAGAASGTRLTRAVGTRGCAGNTGDAYHRRNPDQTHNSQLPYGCSHVRNTLSNEREDPLQPPIATEAATSSPNGIRTRRTDGLVRDT
jgi:hypothetical protein